MEIKNANVAMLSNFEVMSHLQKIKGQQTKSQLTTITYQTSKYLETSPCSTQTVAGVVGILKALEPYNLNKKEKLIIINNPPATPLEIQLMIENSEERLTETQVEEILNLINKHIGKPEVPAEPEEEEEEEETEAT
ncbi:PREDICTED: DNA-directed RNA polymerase III subunit RPC9 [Nicrophorus vespilloides]|uniref:DNA-directed RNA polymerase III subunit RPC9 n=1 Tax=Nicrophorus vespilloides TaxID=110193 RepID=A0ABM1M782_NICVS|nr:PREDICTED: DNA-directed RNA polymerase III subunit RPC9 [Nicrophorus vespilloides]